MGCGSSRSGEVIVSTAGNGRGATARTEYHAASREHVEVSNLNVSVNEPEYLEGTASVSELLSATTLLMVDTSSQGNPVSSSHLEGTVISSSSNLEGTNGGSGVVVIGRMLPGASSQSNVEESVAGGECGVEQQDSEGGGAQASVEPEKEEELGRDKEQDELGDSETRTELQETELKETKGPAPSVSERGRENADGNEADDKTLQSTDSVFLHESQTQLRPHKDTSSNKILRRISICLDGVLILDTHITGTTETSAQGDKERPASRESQTLPTPDAPTGSDAAESEVDMLAAEGELQQHRDSSSGAEQDQSLYKVQSEFLEVPTTRLRSPELVQH